MSSRGKQRGQRSQRAVASAERAPEAKILRYSGVGSQIHVPSHTPEMAVNRMVAGSSPARGVIKTRGWLTRPALCCVWCERSMRIRRADKAEAALSAVPRVLTGRRLRDAHARLLGGLEVKPGQPISHGPIGVRLFATLYLPANDRVFS